MIRVLFWVFTAIGLAVFIGFQFLDPNWVSADDKVVIYGAVRSGTMAVMALGFFIVFIGSLKRQTFVLLERGGGVKEWARDSQPIGYWLSIILLLTTALAFSVAACHGTVTLFPYLHKLFKL